MSTQPIPTSGGVVEYIPAMQDAERFLVEAKERALQRRTAFQAEVDAGQYGDPEPGHQTTAAAQARVAEIDAAERADFKLYDEMKREFPSPQIFLIQIPTTLEREQINSRLTMMGLSQVTLEQTRATMIEELFVRDWGMGSKEANEVHAEELANFLDGCWQRQQAHDAAIERWQEQEIERVLDQGNGAPPLPRADTPPKLISVREQAKLQLLMDDMALNSQRLRALAARNLDYNRLNAVLLARMHIVGVRGFDPPVSLERDPVTKAVSDEQILALRERVDTKSWNDVIRYIDRLYILDGREEKNSVSPLEKPLQSIGSIDQSGGQGDSAGNSTASHIEPRRGDVSATIIEPSFASISVSSEHPERGSLSPTAGV